MVIPKKFQIFGQTYKVKQVVKIDKEGSWGEHDASKNTIKIKKSLTQEQKEQVYLHELMHCMFESLGYDALDRDEILVDTMAKALHQILITSEK
jgi:hypothetical protein